MVKIVPLGILIALLTLGVGCATESASPTPGGNESTLEEGDMAPAFTLPSSDGQEFSLSEFRGRKAVLLYFSMGPG